MSNDLLKQNCAKQNDIKRELPVYLHYTTNFHSVMIRHMTNITFQT
jgi:hypothetical protein